MPPTFGAASQTDSTTALDPRFVFIFPDTLRLCGVAGLSQATPRLSHTGVAFVRSPVGAAHAAFDSRTARQSLGRRASAVSTTSVRPTDAAKDIRSAAVIAAEPTLRCTDVALAPLLVPLFGFGRCCLRRFPVGVLTPSDVIDSSEAVYERTTVMGMLTGGGQVRASASHFVQASWSLLALLSAMRAVGVFAPHAGLLAASVAVTACMCLAIWQLILWPDAPASQFRLPMRVTALLLSATTVIFAAIAADRTRSNPGAAPTSTEVAIGWVVVALSLGMLPLLGVTFVGVAIVGAQRERQRRIIHDTAAGMAEAAPAAGGRLIATGQRSKADALPGGRLTGALLEGVVASVVRTVSAATLTEAARIDASRTGHKGVADADAFTIRAAQVNPLAGTPLGSAFGHLEGGRRASGTAGTSSRPAAAKAADGGAATDAAVPARQAQRSARASGVRVAFHRAGTRSAAHSRTAAAREVFTPSEAIPGPNGEAPATLSSLLVRATR